MAKILTDTELAKIIHHAVSDPGLIDDSDSYEHFLTDLADLIATHFGGESGEAHFDDVDDQHVLPRSSKWYVVFQVNDLVPSDGGVYKDYDTDVTWKDGVETQT